MSNNNWLGPEAGSRMVIAGGCGGIGRELVSRAIDWGIEVTVLDLPKSIEQVPADARVHYIAFDAGDECSIRAATDAVAAHWDRVDSFVFLCGYPILPRRPLSEVSLSDWNALMSVNLTSAYLLSTRLLPLLRASAAPAIVTVASSLGYQVMPGMGAYATSKGGLVTLTKALAAECAPLVRANVVAPGAVETEFLAGGTGQSKEGKDRDWFDQQANKYVSMIPLGRVAKPSDVVDPIMFLAGAGSRYMTGQVLHLNGGRMTP